MPRYLVRERATLLIDHTVEANSPQDARHLVESQDHDPTAKIIAVLSSDAISVEELT